MEATAILPGQMMLRLSKRALIPPYLLLRIASESSLELQIDPNERVALSRSPIQTAVNASREGQLNRCRIAKSSENVHATQAKTKPLLGCGLNKPTRWSSGDIGRI